MFLIAVPFLFEINKRVTRLVNYLPPIIQDGPLFLSHQSLVLLQEKLVTFLRSIKKQTNKNKYMIYTRQADVTIKNSVNSGDVSHWPTWLVRFN